MAVYNENEHNKHCLKIIQLGIEHLKDAKMISK
jgi:hypothetical protein